jgi:hypothetical protein
MSKRKFLAPIIFSFVTAAGYGIIVRLAFTSEQYANVFGTISVGFLFFVPLAVGALTQFFAPAEYRTDWRFAALGPWMPCLIFSVLAVVLTWEAWICVAMALPIFFIMASGGGLLMLVFYIIRAKRTKTHVTVVGLLLFLPFLITPLENQFPRRDSIRTVHTRLEVEAAPAQVWAQITRVAPISEAEHRFSFFHLAGLPRPMSATLTHDGVGGVRRGQWEDGLAFVETISEWTLNENYVMQMEADTSAVAGSPLPLQEIGGRHFDVIQGAYAIEPLGAGRVRLHFTGTYRLSTRFNAYSSLWTDFFMRDVQNYILQIMKARAEKRS